MPFRAFRSQKSCTIKVLTLASSDEADFRYMGSVIIVSCIIVSFINVSSIGGIGSGSI